MALSAFLESDLPFAFSAHHPIGRHFHIISTPASLMEAQPLEYDRRVILEHNEDYVEATNSYRPLEEHHMIVHYADQAYSAPATDGATGPLGTDTRKILTGFGILLLVFILTDGGRGF